MAEEGVDLSSFDDIPDRVARARAKAEAIRKARGGGTEAPSKSAAKAPARRAEGAAGRAAAARSLTAKKEEGPKEREVVIQTSPAPRSVRPGPPRMRSVSEGGITTRRGFFSWLALAWVAFASASTAGLLATARFMFPNVLFEPPQAFKIGFPRRVCRWGGRRAMERQVRRLGRPEHGRDVRPDFRLHPPRVHAELVGQRTEVQVSVSRKRVLCHGNQLRRACPQTSGARPYSYWPKTGQVLVDKTMKFPVRKGAVGSSRVLSRHLIASS